MALFFKQIKTNIKMEDFKKEGQDKKDIMFSKSVKAGKRIYYMDVKQSRNDELYLAITESKKRISGDPSNPDVSFEKHKIFLYQEDMSSFTKALLEVVKYIQEKQPDVPDREPYVREDAPIESTDSSDFLDAPIEINIDDIK